MQLDLRIQLTCLVLASDQGRQQTLTDALSMSARVGKIDQALDQIALRYQLTVQHYDLVLIALDTPDERLPACLLRYPELSVLVISPARKTDPLDEWLQQGATDIVSLQQPDRLRHTLGRILDECILRAKLRHLQNQFRLQQRITQSVLESHSQAVMLWHKGRVIESNERFNDLTNTSGQLVSRTANWKHWLSAESSRELHASGMKGKAEITISNFRHQHFRLSVEGMQMDDGVARLFRLDPTPIGLDQFPTLETDSVTGLPVRASLVQRLQRWIQSPDAARRYTAMLVQLPSMDDTDESSGVGRTLQDLSVYRAADVLQQHFSGNTLLGRTGKNALLLIRPATRETSRAVANHVREALGSLGGLVDKPSSVRINTLTLSRTALSANEVMDRLERL